jgi:hypothetical protein
MEGPHSFASLPVSQTMIAVELQLASTFSISGYTLADITRDLMDDGSLMWHEKKSMKYRIYALLMS